MKKYLKRLRLRFIVWRQAKQLKNLKPQARFMHNHPTMERQLDIWLREPHAHVIVDRKDWETLLEMRLKLGSEFKIPDR